MFIVTLKIISTIALFIVSITMLARANDLRWRHGLHWQTRLIGFILAGSSPVGIIGYGWQDNYFMCGLYLTIFFVGVALVFVTTPYQIPWWRYISGKDQPVLEDRRKPS